MPELTVIMLTPHGDPLGAMGEPDIGGQCMYIRQLGKHLSHRGVSVRAFTRDRGDGKPRVESFAEQASVTRIPCGPRGFVPKEEMLPYLDEFAQGVAGELRGDEILHSHYWDGGYVASKLHERQGWFHSTHSLGRIKRQSLPDDDRYSYKDRIEIEESVFQTCDCVFALTSIEQAQITQLYGVPEQQIRIIPPGVDTEVFAPRGEPSVHRRELALPDVLTVLTLGRLDERKGLDLFVQAARELSARENLPEISFVMSAGVAGSPDDKERAKIDRLVEDLADGVSFTWLPVLEEAAIPTYYNAADVFVLPSRYEPFGIVMLEAMASGIPVVATNNGGPVEVIEDGADGLLGDPHDSQAFASLIASLATDSDKRHAFGERARQKILKHYDWATIAQRFKEAYDEVERQGPNAR